MPDDLEKQLTNLKRKRARERANATRFCTIADEITKESPLDDIELCRERLHDTLEKLVSLDDTIHDLLSDDEYNADVPICEEYIDNIKRAIQKATKAIDYTPSAIPVASQINITPPTVSTHTTVGLHSVKLPAIKLETFCGDIETWSRFWEQFESTIDKDPSLSTINKHVFLRGYLSGEPKMLIDGIPITTNTYEETKKILLKRYGDNNRIIQAHLDYLDALKPVQPETPETLNCTFLECNRRIQALRALGEDVVAYGKVLCPKILRAFPAEMCQKWVIHAKRTEVSEGDVLKLLNFLEEEVQGALTAQKIRGEQVSSSSFTPTAATFHVNSKQAKNSRKVKRDIQPYCVFCEARTHWGQDCNVMTDVQQRIAKLKLDNRCFICLNRGHNAKTCNKKDKVSCSKCKKRHHKAICTDTAASTSASQQVTTTSVGKIDVNSADFTYLQTARVWISGPTGLRKLTRCILDSGSQSSFISKLLIDELGLKTLEHRDLSVSAFEMPTVTSTHRRVVEFTLKGIWENVTTCVTAFESTYSFAAHPTVPSEIRNIVSTRKLQLADPKDDTEDLPIEILIGADYYWKIVKDSPPIRLSSSIVLVPSNMGWILSGSKSSTTANLVTANYISLETVTSTDDILRSFWNLETMGITEDQTKTPNEKELALLQDFAKSYCIEDKRRVVSLPRKPNIIVPSNFTQAENRFISLEKKLAKNRNLKHIYEAQMIDHIQKGHIEVTPPEQTSNETFYLPHHAVKKEKLGVSKWRVVFDGSSHEKTVHSLNEALEIGPNLLPDILSVLMRFRLYPFALIADIKQAFLQLVLHRKDRDLTRFFWFKVIVDQHGNYITTDEKITYRFTRLPFGLACSPFLLAATLKELATMHKQNFPQAASLVEDNMYMDDFVAGAEDDNAVITLYHELKSLMGLISLPMAKWATNSRQLIEVWQSEGLVNITDTEVLGVHWNTQTDTFSVLHNNVIDGITNHPATKREVLRRTARFYDPLGLLSPVSLTAKLIFQEIWSRGIVWDELLPFDLGKRWQIWISTLPSCSHINVPRWIGVSKDTKSEIHVFTDASEKAYGAVLYLRCSNSNITSVHFVCSKNRLAPIKKLTLPRLELLATLLGSRLLHYFCKATSYNASSATLWTDSTVALGWIQQDPNRWKTFVSNRVTEIQRLTNPSQWRHCPGEQNPADLLSRGTTADKLQHSTIWFHGPPWLIKNRTHWPQFMQTKEHSLPEKKKLTEQVLMVETRPPILTATRYSNYYKLLRVTGWILRFKRQLIKQNKTSGELTASELHEARTYWIQVVQQQHFTVELHALQNNLPLPQNSKIARFNPFLDNGIIRLGGRLHFAQLPREQRHPIILDGQHHFTHLLILQTHIRLHHLGVNIVLSELRAEFWILRARQAIKRVLHRCLPCKMAKAQSIQQIEAPLPPDRVSPLKPFEVTGIDFAGPLYVRQGHITKKSYIALFTCATTRALHMELCSDMSTDKFLQALQRFVGRRGVPNTIYTDNATTFHSTHTELKELWQTLKSNKMHNYLAQQGITWKFIAPHAPWWGGFWERMVGSVKRCLRKVLGQSQLDEEGLSTVLVSIEAALNSRPITQGGEETEPLTPAHFLVGDRLTTLPTGPEPPVKRDLSKEYQRQQRMVEHFWDRWEKEYLILLKNFHETRGPRTGSGRLHLGDVVLLKEDVRPRHMWKKARIEDLHEGRDGKIRTVTLRTAEGSIISRPIQLVIPLEIDQGGEDIAG